MTVSLHLYHINYMAKTTIIIMQVRSAEVQYTRDHPERFV